MMTSGIGTELLPLSGDDGEMSSKPSAVKYGSLMVCCWLLRTCPTGKATSSATNETLQAHCADSSARLRHLPALSQSSDELYSPNGTHPAPP